MIISNPKTRMLIHEEKKNKILLFLKQETYSNSVTLMRIINCKNKSSISRILNKLESQQLIKRHNLHTYGNKTYHLWGISQCGLARAYHLEDEALLLPTFQPSKLRLPTLEHHLSIQNIRLTLQEKGSTNWIHGDRSTFYSKYSDVKHRPDGVITLPNNINIALEVELNVKTKSRYKNIMTSHLLAITKKHWNCVYYILPSEDKKKLIMKIFDSITMLTVNNNPVILEQKHKNVFMFFTFDEIQNKQFI